ncbi:hypothetical protein JOE64_001378 [Microbacterium dextranolyticum]|nr:hypothetical protein [Microbacterium dextranolyticum]
MSLSLSPSEFWALTLSQREALIRAHNKRAKKG